MIGTDLLAILGCPACPERPPFRLEGNYLICAAKGHGFQIVDGIPHLLPEDAIPPEKMKELLDEP